MGQNKSFAEHEDFSSQGVTRSRDGAEPYILAPMLGVGANPKAAGSSQSLARTFIVSFTQTILRKE